MQQAETKSMAARIDEACNRASAVSGGLQELALCSDLNNLLTSLSKALDPVTDLLEELLQREEKANQQGASP